MIELPKPEVRKTISIEIEENLLKSVKEVLARQRISMRQAVEYGLKHLLEEMKKGK